jgi:ribosomal RNA assembly protein
MRYVRIPMERLAVLIGHNGEVKQKIEETTNVSINIDSELGDITIDDSEDPLQALKVENIILAIGRGFSPDHAFRLLSDEVTLFIFDIHDYVGRKPSHIKRIKGRIIGTGGKTKHILEQLTESNVSIYGHTVAVIANFVVMDIIKKAIDRLLSGHKHASVYRYVETNMKDLRMEGIL